MGGNQGGSGGIPTGGGGSGPTAGGGGTGGCDADLQSDPSNCGVCGHDCMGGNCTGGECEAVLLASGFSGGGELDVEDGMVFWVESTGISQVAADGSTSSSQLVAAGEVKSLDAANGAVYFSRREGLSDAALSKKVLPDGAFSNLSQAAGTINTPRNFFGVTAPANQVFFSDVFSQTVRVIPTTGGTASDFATGEAGVSGTAVGGDTLYWVTAQGQVRAKAVLGGNVSTVADVGSAAPHDVDATADTVAWASGGSGAVYTKVGANVTTVVTGLSDPTDVAIDGTRLFIAVDAEGVYLAPDTQAQGAAKIAPNVSSALRLAQDDNAIYLTTATEIWRLAKPPVE